MALAIDTSPDNMGQNQMTSNRINNLIIVDQKEQLTFAAEIYNTWLPVLKNGEPKALWCILYQTVGTGRISDLGQVTRNKCIANDEFYKYGSSLTKSRDIIYATDGLVELGLISKVVDKLRTGKSTIYSLKNRVFEEKPKMDIKK